MPVKVQADLPVKEILESENIFVMDETRAVHQDIRPLKIMILNLMPLKEDTELQLLRSLSNTSLQVDVTFRMQSLHQPVTTWYRQQEQIFLQTSGRSSTSTHPNR